MTAVRCIKPNLNDTQLQFAKAALLDEELFAGGRCLDGLNRYVYCHNNPVKYIDPTGHAGESATLPIIWGIAAAEPTIFGKLAAAVVIIVVLSQAETDTKTRETEYRYVSEGWAAVIAATGVIPNTDKDGNPKLVFLIFSDCETTEEAEQT